MAKRMAAMEAWLRDRLGLVGFDLQTASDDASFRRYFRLTLADGQQRIVMDAPPDKEDCRPFVAIARAWRENGVHVPRVYAEELEQGFLLLEDLGRQHYLDCLDEQNADRHYADALAALTVIQSRGDPSILPAYDEALLRQEMALFPDWLLQRQLGLSLSEVERQMLAAAFDCLVENALAQPQVCVHRDYHSRNLLVTPSQSPGVIDFQDAVVGPVTYDLVSLLRDCYIGWPRNKVNEWALGYCQRAMQLGILRAEHEAGFLRWFDLMGIQRQLKASGIFARLNLRDGKSGYLKDIPRTLGYLVEVAPDYPEMAPLGEFVSRRVVPAL